MLFISHSKKDKEIVNSFINLIKIISPKIECKASSCHSNGPATGDDWTSWIVKEAASCRTAVILFTPNSLNSHWVHFEAGVFAGSTYSAINASDVNNNSTSMNLNKVLPVLIGIPNESLPIIFSKIQASDGCTIDGLSNLLKNIARNYFVEHSDDYDQAAGNIIEKKGFDSYLNSVNSYIDGIGYNLSKNICALKVELDDNVDDKLKNQMLMKVYSYFMERVQSSIKKYARSPLYVPSYEYPRYLTEIQSKNTEVDAIAIVDEVEKFWLGNMGQKILNVSDKNNTKRVFVYMNKKHLADHIYNLYRHKKKYQVKVISQKELKKISNECAYDYSIIRINESNEDTVLARYENDPNYQECIMFTDDSNEIDRHQYEFNKVWEASLIIPLDDQSEPDKWIDSVFNEKKEMSKYINIENYERYELLHPYFVEMMDKMLKLYKEKNIKSTHSKLLEMGAGTGHLTYKIKKADDDNTLNYGQLLALEFDNECYEFLQKKMRSEKKIFCLNEDAAFFDPSGKFDFIFSSFADHHIAKNDTFRSYLNNIKRNLHAGSYFIVGDEFLPDHDHENLIENNNAVNVYHDHIIKLAKKYRDEADENEKSDWDGMIELEENARISGLNNNGTQGDHKVSLKTYLKRLKEANLEYEEPYLIGPEDDNLRKKTGGIYVICIHLPKNGKIE